MPVCTIAVLEDDRDLQFMYKLKLENEGFKVITASDGEQGLAIVNERKPDMILLDLKLPLLSGTELLTRLREQPWASNIRVIVLTNVSKLEAPQALRFLGVDRYVVKAHHTPAQVVAMVREVMGISPP